MHTCSPTSNTCVRHGYMDPVVSKEKTISTGPPGPATPAGTLSVSSTGSRNTQITVNLRIMHVYGRVPFLALFAGLASSVLVAFRF